MNRRNFIKQSSAAGIASSIGLTSCNKSSENKKLRVFDSASFKDEFILNELTIDELQEKMKAGDLTSRSITDLYLNRIEEIDRKGPKLNAVIELNPDAQSNADAMDNERKSGKIRGPLHGIPVLIKDNIDTGDKMMTTAGSLALEGHRSARDAFIIKKLRDAGAVILGKTNLSEWANWRSTRSTSGWSSRGGQTRNPYILERNPTGSSSGSAVGVAANLCSVAIGTETDGSIIGPASFNGIIGLKPTVGLLSRTGIIPISKTQDTPGPMTRTVKDAAILLGTLVGEDTEDSYTEGSKERSFIDYTKFCIFDGLRNKRIGIERYPQNNHEDVAGLYEKAIGVMKLQGAEIIEVELLKIIREAKLPELTVLMYEFKDGINQYLAGANAGVKSLTEIIAFNRQNKERAMPYFKQERLEACDLKGGLDSLEYKEAIERTLYSRRLINGLMSEHKLDALCGVTSGPACCIDLINGDYDTGYYYGSPAAMAGFPHITLPMGFVHELPVGLSFIAGAFTEDKLFEIAYAYEQASKHRTPPKFIKDSIPG